MIIFIALGIILIYILFYTDDDGYIQSPIPEKESRKTFKEMMPRIRKSDWK